MKKFKLNPLYAGIIATLVIIFGGIFFFSSRQGPVAQTEDLGTPENYEYYWSVTCPHCKKVNDFMETWDGKDKIKIDKYEVNESPQNTQRFLARGEFCKIPRKGMGVPLLITPSGICLTGDEPIIRHFQDLKFE